MLKRIVEEDHTHFRFLAGLMLFQTIVWAVLLGQFFFFVQIPTGDESEGFLYAFILIASFAPPFTTYLLWIRHEDSLVITTAWLICCIYLLVPFLIVNNPNWLVLQLALGVPSILGLPVSLIYYLRKLDSFIVHRSDEW